MTPRRIVITGAASGIGAAISARLVADGHRCIAVDRLPAVAGDSALCDLSDERAIAACVASIEGHVDGVAYVAGVAGTADAATVLKVNYLGARRFIEALSPRIVEGGSIVVVSSLSARRCAFELARLHAILALPGWSETLAALEAGNLGGGAAYEIAKRLLLAWTPIAAAAGAARRIRFNAVTPGPVETPLLPGFRASMGEDRIEAARTLVGRHASAEEVAAPILFLLDPASSWINGIEIVADGGLSALREAELASAAGRS